MEFIFFTESAGGFYIFWIDIRRDIFHLDDDDVPEELDEAYI